MSWWYPMATKKSSSKKSTSKKTTKSTTLKSGGDQITITASTSGKCSCGPSCSCGSSCSCGGCGSKSWGCKESGGCGYFLGFLGAAIYYISTATGFWGGVLGVLKAIVWPVFIVLKILGM